MTAKDTVVAHYEAMSRGDREAAFSAVAPDVRWTESAGSAYPGTFVGLDDVVAHVFEPLGRDWRDLAAVPSDVIHDGETVVVLGTYRGAHRETGRDMDARFAHVWRVREGRVVEFEQIVDSARQLAAMP